MSYSAAPAAGDTGYYTSGGGGREEYYLASGAGVNPPGTWSGKLAEELGLTGEVKAEDMAHVYDTLTGLNGEKLGQAPPSRGRYAPIEVQLEAWKAKHPGALPEEIETARAELTAKKPQTAIDVTYGAAKSVTLLWVAAERVAQTSESRGNDEKAERMRGHAALVDRIVSDGNAVGLRWVESSGALVTHVGWYTGGRDGAERYSEVEGLITASFPQYTGQAGDPHRHEHNVIALRAKAADGSIRRPDGFVLKGAGGAKWGMAAVTETYITERLYRVGIPMVMRPDGVAAECSLVEQDMIDLYSKRTLGQIKPKVRQLMEEYKERNGVDKVPDHIVSAMTRIAKTVTRGRKVAEGKSRAELYNRWMSESWKATAGGLITLGVALDQALTEGAKNPPKAVKFSPEAVKAEALARVSEDHATWTEHRLMAAVGSALPPGWAADVPDELLEEAVLTTVSRLTTEILESQEAVQVAGLGIESQQIEAAEKYGSPTHVRYAARGTMAAEEAILKASVERGGHSLTRGAIEDWIGANAPTIGEDQRAALIALATTDARVAVLEAPAGTGKSYTVGRLAEAWETLQKAGRVHGIAVGSRQAEVLAEEGLTTTANTTVWLAAQERIAAGRARPDDHKLRVLAGDLVVLDEASQVERAQAERIIEAVRAAGARVVFVQDPRQMQSVGAGGVPGLLENHAETYRLTEVRRFEEEWEKAASLRIRECDTSVLAEYDRRGRLVAAETPEGARQAAARAVFVDMAEGKTSMAVAGSNLEAGQVAALVREHLVEAGLVDAHGIELGEEVGGGIAGRRDLVQIRQNDTRLEVKNRQVWTVEDVRADGGMRVVDERTGEFRDLPASYVAEHVALAYGGTVNAVQGVTLDREHGVFTGGLTTAEAVYVAMSRGKEANTAHVFCPVNETTEERPSARAVLAESVARDGREVAATVAKERDELERQSVRFVIGRQEDITNSACLDRTQRHLDILAAEGVLTEVDRAKLGADDSMEHLARRLRSAEQAGHDPAEVLREAVESGSLAKAGSVAQVLAWRIGESHGAEDIVRSDMPADIDPVYAARWENVAAMIAEREKALGSETAEKAPEWAVKAFGQVPEAGTEERAAWEERAARVAAVREGRAWTDEKRALPGAPSEFNTERRSLWFRGYEALGRPSEQVEEAAMTPGQLRVRVKAWDRILDRAPAYADEDLKEVHRLQAEAREQAVFAKDEIAKKAAQRTADIFASAAKRLGRQAEVRDEYLEQNRATREFATRAAAELGRREEPAVGEEPDLTTGAEWLGIETAARVEDDQHRTITEADLVQEERAPAPSWMEQLQPVAQDGDTHAERVEKADPYAVFLPSYRPPVAEEGYTEAEEADLDQFADRTMDLIADQRSLDAQVDLAYPDPYDTAPVAAPVQDDGYEIGGLGY